MMLLDSLVRPRRTLQTSRRPLPGEIIVDVDEPPPVSLIKPRSQPPPGIPVVAAGEASPPPSGRPRTVQSLSDAVDAKMMAEDARTGDGSVTQRNSALPLSIINPAMASQAQRPGDAPYTTNPPAPEAMPAVRPRQVSPPDALTRDTAYLDELRTAPLEKMSRLKAGALMALRGAGQAAQASLASGNPSLGASLGGAIGGMAGGTIRPRAAAQMARDEQIARAQNAVANDLAIVKARGDVEAQAADTDYRVASADWMRRRPTDKPVYKKQGGIIYQVRPAGTATPLVGENGEPLAPDYQRPVFLDVLGEDGVSVTKLRYNAATNTYEPVTVDGENPVVTKRVQKIDPETGMTTGQMAADADRDASRAGTERHRRVMEGQGQQRISQKAAPLSGINAGDRQRGLAAKAIGKFQDLVRKGRAARTARERAAYFQQAEQQGRLIRSQFGSLVEDDEQGWPTRLQQQRQAPTAPTRRRQQHSGRSADSSDPLGIL